MGAGRMGIPQLGARLCLLEYRKPARRNPGASSAGRRAAERRYASLGTREAPAPIFLASPRRSLVPPPPEARAGNRQAMPQELMGVPLGRLPPRGRSRYRRPSQAVRRTRAQSLGSRSPKHSPLPRSLESIGMRLDEPLRSFVH